MKATYGFTPQEFVAEKLYSEDFFTWTQQAPIQEVVDGWTAPLQPDEVTPQ